MQNLLYLIGLLFFYSLIQLKINKYILIYRKNLKITKQILFSSTYIDPYRKQKIGAEFLSY